MELRRYQDILGIKTKQGRFVGFHTRNLELAEIDQAAWDRMQDQHIDEALSELTSWNREDNPQVEDLKATLEVSALSLNIAQVCNLQCTYCGADGDGTYGSKTAKIDVSKAIEQVHAFISRLKTSKTFSIQFFGGEPLLFPHAIRQIGNYARLLVADRDIELIFQIVTNGTLITPENAELLADLNAWVTISVDGPPEINDKMRPSKSKTVSSSEQTLAGIKNILAVRDRLRYLQFNSVFGSHNMDISKTYDYLRAFDFDMINLAYATSSDDEQTSLKYVEQMHLVAQIVYAREGLEGLKKIAQFADTLRLIEFKKRLWDYCSGGKSGVRIDTDARLFACNWLMNDTSEAIGQGTEFSEKRMREFSSTLLETNNCQGCWARFLCGGGCMAENKFLNGQTNLKNLNFCYRTRQLAALSIQYLFHSLGGEEIYETHQKTSVS